MGLVSIDPASEFLLYHPASSGDDHLRTELTVLSIKQTIPNFEALIRSVGLQPEVQPTETFARTDAQRDAVRRLGECFNHYGSDKAAAHGYDFVYGTILAERTGGGMLEVGIGSNNTAIVSNMGAGHPPGASLRAFRDFTRSRVYGADFDKDILFEEDLIECLFVDQTNPSSFLNLDAVVPDGLDLVIDDGLHAPNANLATLEYGLRKVRPGGWVVVEDIWEPSVALWHVVHAVLSRKMQCHLLRGRVHYVFAVQKN